MTMTDAPTRREANRVRRRQEYLDVASKMVIRQGIDRLTMQAIADEVGAAVGTIYTYFPSKSALIAELQSMALTELGMVYDAAELRWEAALAEVDPRVAALANLGLLGDGIVAAKDLYPEEFMLQQQLLVEKDPVLDDAEAAVVFGPAMGLADRPRRMLDAAVEVGALRSGDSFFRSLTLVSSLNGVLLLESLSRFNVPGIDRLDLLCHNLTFDLLRGWGADDGELAQAEECAARISEGPDFLPKIPRWTDWPTDNGPGGES